MLPSFAALWFPLVAAVAFAAVVVLPGFAVLRLLHRRDTARGLHASLPELVAWSVVVVAGLTVGTVPFGLFGRPLAALTFAALALVAAPAAARWLWARREQWGTALLLFVLAIPAAESSVMPGYPPSHTLQWYYWNLGTALGRAGGVPESVQEFSIAVRWLPDYVLFNVMSESYAGLLFWAGDADVIGPWRFGALLLGLATLRSMLALWLRPAAALLGTATVTTTVFWLHKFNAYKPEAVGLCIGFAAVVLLVRGIRERDGARMLLAGAAIGLAVAVHAIAATACGLLLVAAGLVEVVGHDRARGSALLGAALAGALAIGAVVAMGVSVQGRATVAGDALKPQIVNGIDPTWQYIQLENGVGNPSARLALAEQIERAEPKILRPWPRTRMDEKPGLAYASLLCLGVIACAGLGRREERRGLAVVLLFTAMLGGVVASFAYGFETYVPRNTGLSRFVQYSPLCVGLASAFAVAGAGHLAQRGLRHTLEPERERRLTLFVTAAFWLVALTVHHRSVDAYSRMSEGAMRAMDYLNEHGDPGDVILANANTAGAIEFFTGLEAPLEGRQPLIEAPAFLAAANTLYSGLYPFFRGSQVVALDFAHRSFLEHHRVRWILVANKAVTLGSAQHYGGTAAELSRLGYLRPAWSGGGVHIFEVKGVPQAEPHPVVARRSGGPAAAVLGLAALGLALLAWLIRRPGLGLTAQRRRA